MRSSFIPAALLLVFSAFVALMAELAPSRTVQQLAVIYPPGASLETHVTQAVAAGAQVVRSGVTSNILIVYGGDADQLYRHGALLVLNAVIEGNCILSPRRV